jgi:hypothetical protein
MEHDLHLNLHPQRTDSPSEGQQTFTYISPTLQLTPSDLLFLGSPFAVPPPEWIHVVCDAARATAITHEAESFRSQGWVGSMVWEPLIRVRCAHRRHES